MGPLSSALSRVISVTASPVKRRVFQSTVLVVEEKTTFGMSRQRWANSISASVAPGSWSAVGQWELIISQILRPYRCRVSVESLPEPQRPNVFRHDQQVHPWTAQGRKPPFKLTDQAGGDALPTMRRIDRQPKDPSAPVVVGAEHHAHDHLAGHREEEESGIAPQLCFQLVTRENVAAGCFPEADNGVVVRPAELPYLDHSTTKFITACPFDRVRGHESAVLRLGAGPAG